MSMSTDNIHCLLKLAGQPAQLSWKRRSGDAKLNSAKNTGGACHNDHLLIINRQSIKRCKRRSPCGQKTMLVVSEVETSVLMHQQGGQAE